MEKWKRRRNRSHNEERQNWKLEGSEEQSDVSNQDHGRVLACAATKGHIRVHGPAAQGSVTIKGQVGIPGLGCHLGTC